MLALCDVRLRTVAMERLASMLTLYDGSGRGGVDDDCGHSDAYLKARNIKKTYYTT